VSFVRARLSTGRPHADDLPVTVGAPARREDEPASLRVLSAKALSLCDGFIVRHGDSLLAEREESTLDPLDLLSTEMMIPEPRDDADGWELPER
jgi:hypothetical protein